MPPEQIPGWESLIGLIEPEQLELLPVAEVVVEDEPTCDEPHCDDPTDEYEPVGYSIGDLLTETPAPHRAHTTPTPAPEHPSLDAPPAPTPTPPPVLDRERAYQDLTVRPEPIRVHVHPPAGVVKETSSGGNDAGRLVDRHPADRGVVTVTTRPLVPDAQREAWVLDQVHGVLLEMRDHASWLQPLHDLVSDIRASAEEVRARIESNDREANERRTAELAAQLARPAWRKALASPHSQRAFGLVTWLAGAMAGGIACGIADYLGLETEPVIRFFAQFLGAL